MSFAKLAKSIEELRLVTEEYTTEANVMVETIERLETGMRAGANREANAVNSLLSGQGFSYLFDIWLAQAVANPSDPGLALIEQYIRQWTGAGRDVNFGTLRRMIRKRTEAVQRSRGRDARLTDAELQGILDEVMGR